MENFVVVSELKKKMSIRHVIGHSSSASELVKANLDVFGAPYLHLFITINERYSRVAFAHTSPGALTERALCVDRKVKLSLRVG